MSWYYPDDEEALYYVEFERGEKKGEATLFKRQWLYPKEEWERMLQQDSRYDFMGNEMHPWNIFTIGYGPPGCIPDETWVKWMVDCLNAAVEKSS